MFFPSSKTSFQTGLTIDTAPNIVSESMNSSTDHKRSRSNRSKRFADPTFANTIGNPIDVDVLRLYDYYDDDTYAQLYQSDSSHYQHRSSDHNWAGVLDGLRLEALLGWV